MTLALLTEIFGWILLFNLVYLFLAGFLLIVFRSMIITLHQKMFDLSEQSLNQAYFKFLANYKLVTVIFVLCPYLALKLVV